MAHDGGTYVLFKLSFFEWTNAINAATGQVLPGVTIDAVGLVDVYHSSPIFSMNLSSAALNYGFSYYDGSNGIGGNPYMSNGTPGTVITNSCYLRGTAEIDCVFGPS